MTKSAPDLQDTQPADFTKDKLDKRKYSQRDKIAAAKALFGILKEGHTDLDETRIGLLKDTLK